MTLYCSSPALDRHHVSDLYLLFSRCIFFNLSFSNIRNIIFFFFFFQAEDGIRDYKVTGVQTCALPILNKQELVRAKREQILSVARKHGAVSVKLFGSAARGGEVDSSDLDFVVELRSEERRVGKECRSRWSPYH